MKTFSKPIIIRKLLHIGTSFFPISYIFIPRLPMLIGLFALAFSFLVFDFLRLKIKSVGDSFYHYCGKGLWEKEKYSLTSATHYAVAAFLSVYLFEKWIAIAALLFLAFGDTAAHLIGVKYGKTRIGSEISDKTIEGSLACMIICLSISVLLPEPALPVLFVGSIVASLVEFFPFGIDDNFTLPLITGAAMEIMVKIL